jgi:hypothetical protein
MEFDPPKRLSLMCNRGTGDLGDVDEAQLAQTVYKPTELRRIEDESQVELMASRSQRQRCDLIRRVLERS